MKKIFLVILLVFLFSIFTVNAEVILKDPSIRVDLVSISPSPVQKGKDFDVTFNVENFGTEALNEVKLQITEQFPFLVRVGESSLLEFPTIQPGESKTITYKLRTNANAETGTTPLSLQISIRSVDLTPTYVATFDVDITESDSLISIDQVTTIPSRIKPGEESILKFTLQNNAITTIRDIIVKLDFNNVPITPLRSTNERRVAFINTNDAITLNFDIIADADAASKPYKIPLNITFYDILGNKLIRESTIGILVDSPPQIQFDLEETEVFTKGGKGKVIISASNIGPSDIKFLSMELKESRDYTLLSNKRIYVGNLDSDDFETAEFELVARRKTNREGIDLLLEVTYKDAFNKETVHQEIIKLDIFSSLKAKRYGLIPSGNLANIIIYIIVIMFIYAVWKDWRKEKDLGKSIKKTGKRWFFGIIHFIQKLFNKLFSKRR